MDNLSEHQPRLNTIEQAQVNIRKVLNDLRLVDYFAKENRQSQGKTIAILGAGTAVEALPLTQYFVESGLGKPKIIAFDPDEDVKRLTEEIFKGKDVGLEYRSADAANPNSFRDEKYDVVIIRKPDIHNGERTWRQVFQNGFDHLKSEGVLIATTDLYSDFVLEEIQRGGELAREAYTIPEENIVPPYLTEFDLFIARKKTA